MNGAHSSSRATDGSGARVVVEGLRAGALLALADALATGVQRVPLAMLAWIAAFWLLAGSVAGLVAARTGRRGHATALVLALGTALGGLSLVSKELTGSTTAPSIGVVVAALAVALASLPARQPSARLASFATFAAIPGASLLATGIGATAVTIVFASALPLVPLAVVGWAEKRERRGLRAAIDALAVAAVVAPVAVGESEVARPDVPITTSASAAAPDAPDVLLVIVDTLRADALPPDGYFAALASEGARFTNCTSTAPWTLPSVSSILTSLVPSQHGAIAQTRALDRDVSTLAEAFAEGGYATAAFTGGAFVGPAFRIDRGFHHFDATPELGFRPFQRYVPIAWRVAKNRYAPLRAVARWIGEYPGAAGIRAAAERWLAAREAGRPAFVLAHTYEAHDYYLYHPGRDDDLLESSTDLPSTRFAGRLSVHPSEFVDATQSDLDWFRAIYAHRIRDVEREVHALVDAMEASSERELVVALVSDHGEGFDAARQRVHHGGRLHDDLLSVPLVVRARGRAPAVALDAQVSTLDVMPTLLELAGLPIPEQCSGRPLFGAPSPDERIAWSEERSNGRDLVSARARDWKVVAEGERARGFDLRADPLEDTALPASDVPEELVEGVRGFGTTFPAVDATSADVDDATREHLRGIGYVE